MSAVLDTNVVIRHLAGDPPAMARRATRSLADADELIPPDLIVAETVYVLESFYQAHRPQVVELVRAVEIYEVHRLDFAEAYLVATAERLGAPAVVSFDNAVGRVGTVRHLVPGDAP